MKTLDKIILFCALIPFLVIFGYTFILIAIHAYVRADTMFVLGLAAFLSLLVFLLVLRRYPGVYAYLMQYLKSQGEGI